MIDVSHPSTAAYIHRFAHTNHDRHQHTTGSEANGTTKEGATTVPGESEDGEEAAWLQSIQSAGLDSVTEVKGLQSGALVLDMSQLRQEPAPSSAKKALKSALR